MLAAGAYVNSCIIERFQGDRYTAVAGCLRRQSRRRVSFDSSFISKEKVPNKMDAIRREEISRPKWVLRTERWAGLSSTEWPPLFSPKKSSSDSFHWHPHSGENSRRSFQQKRDDSAPNERGFYHYLRIPEYVSSRAWLYAKHGRGGKGGSERNAFLKKRKFRFRRNETFFSPLLR